MRATPLFPYLALLRVGFTLPPVLPPARCALTAPFHPYLATYPWHTGTNTGAPKAMLSVSGVGDQAVCFLWHWPWARAPQALPGTLPNGARTFLPVARPKMTARAVGRLSGRLPLLLYPCTQSRSHGNADFSIKEGLIYPDLPTVHGSDCSDVQGCTNAAGAGCGGAAQQSFAFPPLHLDVQVPRSTGGARAAIHGGQMWRHVRPLQVVEHEGKRKPRFSLSVP